MRRMGALARLADLARGGYRSIRRLELAVLLSALAVVVLAFGFAKLGSDIAEGDTDAFDRWVMQALRDPHDAGKPLGPEWLRAFGRDLTSLGSAGVLVFVVAATAGGLALAGKRRTMAFILGATGSGVLLAVTLKAIYSRERPDEAIRAVIVTSSSFPSGHAMNAAIVYVTLGTFIAPLVRRRAFQVYVFAASVALAALVGATRVYLGVHYPTDVAAGLGAGFAWAIAWWLASELYRRRRDGARRATPDGPLDAPA
jgi:undecaprenyl-diphosphatase